MTRASPASGIEMDLLKQCPCCGGNELLAPLPPDAPYDNGLEAWIRQGRVTRFGGYPASAFARVEWRVCGHCALIFCLKRPSLEDSESWYGELFRAVERREYAVNPLPEIYLANQKSFASELVGLLEDHHVLDGVQSALHLRCNAGYILNEVRNAAPGCEVHGIEYFDAPAEHARALLGTDAITVIRMPEPRNPFGRRTFDLVLAEHFMIHAHDPAGYLDYLAGLLSPTGKLVVFNEQDHAKTLTSGGHYRRGINFFHKQLFTRDTLGAFLRSRGFTVKELPHPPGRKWAVSNDSVLFVCERGEARPMPAGDASASMRLMRDWWAQHQRNARFDWLTRPIGRWKRRLSGRREAARV